MKKTTLNSFNILDKLSLDLSINENIYNIDIDSLMTVGARINPKRSFLFISKLLGKHLDVNPNIPKVAGHLLSNLYLKHYHNVDFSNVDTLVKALNGNVEGLDKELNRKYLLDSPVLFIGFAETATGLGHAVFSSFYNGYYTHTTREDIKDYKSVFDFNEEHSHATGHSCFLIEKSLFNIANRVVLIDDEITTGKTSLNLIKEIKENFGVDKFTILSILDWRTKEWLDYEKKFCDENNIDLDVLSLISGEINITKDYTFEDTAIEESISNTVTAPTVRNISKSNISGNKISALTNKGEVYYSKYTGRFGIPSFYNDDIEKMSKYMGYCLSKERKYDKTLVLGMGEFIYIPSRIASFMGDNVYYKSSTRSPIFCNEGDNYPIQNRIKFKINDIQYYLYNMKDVYEEVFIIHETPLSNRDKNEIIKQLALCNLRNIVFFKF